MTILKPTCIGKCFKLRLTTILCAVVVFGCFYKFNLIPHFKIRSGWLRSRSLKVVDPNDTNPHWIVVTSIASPTKDIEKLAAIPNWKLVVIGDAKTPSNWSYPGVVYLSVDDQKRLGYEIVGKVPTNSYTRKMIGYLYAIQHGARYVYDTDDDNHPTNGDITFILDDYTRGLIYDDLSRQVMNPLPHFGQAQLWPRGYPLDQIAFNPIKNYRSCIFRRPSIQQGLVNGDPDMDAIYRLIYKGSDSSKTINITFNEHAPHITLPSGVFAPFNSQNTFFAYDSLWALFLPTTVAFRVTDIWRGYWAQRLLWLIGRNLAFFPPNAVQIRNAHSYLKDFEEEIQMYKEAGSLIEFLYQWQCQDQFTFFQCVKKLTGEMVERQFLKAEDEILMDLWLNDLTSVGYQEPKRETVQLNDMCTKDVKIHIFHETA